jgi:hypothetical protein
MNTAKVPSRTSKLLTVAVNLVKERRLPWRVSQWLARRNLNALRRHYDRKVLSTRPYRTGEDCPHFELHMLLGHLHVGMCLWSVKSFLHCSGKKYTVVLHDDGSLTDVDIATLQEHLVGARVMQKAVADRLVRESIGNFSNCCEYRFTAKETSDHRGEKYNMLIFAIRLFDFNLISNARKTLVLDADVLFFREPREIIEWAEDPADRNSLYSVEQYVPVRNERNEIVDYQRKMPTPNAGLLCFDKRAFDLGAIDAWIGAKKELMYKYPTFEQATYNHLVKRKGGSAPLPDSYSFNYTDDRVVATHFAIKVLFFRNLNRLETALT